MIKNNKHHTDFSSHFPNELVEFNHPHDAAVYVPESNYVLGDGFDSQFGIHEPSFQHGQQWPTSYIHKRKSKSE